MKRSLYCAIAFGAATLLPATPPRAQEAAQPSDRSTAFVAVEGPTREDVPGGGLLVAAYISAFVLLSFYVLYVLQIQQRALAMLAALKKTK